MGLGRGAFRRLSWRAGTKQPLRSRFAAVRVRAAHRDYGRDEPHPQQWLLIEWPTKEARPIKYWLANLPEKTKSKDLVAAAKQRWIIERDYQELKQELGLGHYEGRGWRHCSDPSPSRRGRSVRAGRPIRAERHNPTSIATRRTQLAHHIPPQLERCPFCGSVFLEHSSARMFAQKLNHSPRVKKRLVKMTPLGMISQERVLVDCPRERYTMADAA